MKALKNKLGKNGGFTLVEMLIVVAIIAILVAVSIPLVNSALEKANDATDQANERAAKAEASLIALNATTETTMKTTLLAGTKVYYDAIDGKLVADKATALHGASTGYGKCTAGTNCYQTSKSHVGLVVTVTYDASTESFTIDWE